MSLVTYINYGGNCRLAFEFYEKHLGGKIVMLMTHGEMPPNPNGPGPEWADKVLHAKLDIAGTSILGADVPNAEPMRSAYLTLSFDTVDETERVYALLSQGGEIFMQIQETFFAKRFAMFRDRFGTSWMLLGAQSPPPA